MRRGRILILMALILLFGAAAAYLLLSGRGPGASEAQPTPEAVPSDMVFVAVAAQNISRGAFIPDTDGVIFTQMPRDLVVETMVSGESEEMVRSQIIGKRARMEILRGVPVTEAMLTEEPNALIGPGSDASMAIPAGYTAISVPMTRLSGVAYALRAGDVVDVLVTMLLVDLDPDFQSLVPNLVVPALAPGGTDEAPAPVLTMVLGEFQDDRAENLPPFMYGKIITEPELEQPMHVFPQEQQRPRMVTQRLIEAARVLQVGTFPLEEPEVVATAEVEEGAGAPPPQSQSQTQTTTALVKPDIITLIISPQDALALNWAMKSGVDLVLTLRAPGDTTLTETTSVTLQYFIDNYNITVPTKLPYGLEPAVDEIIEPVLPNDAKPSSGN
jgi:Flp pilus assembly protein CpaB